MRQTGAVSYDPRSYWVCNVGSRSGRTDHAHQPFAPGARPPQIAGQRRPFMESDDRGVVGMQRRHQAVTAWHVVALPREGSEQAVEHDEDAAVIAVEIFRIGGVVHAMMGGRVEHIFEPTEFRYPFGVQPELVERNKSERPQEMQDR